MKKFRNIVLFLLVAVLTFSVTACGKKKTNGREGYIQIYAAVNSDGFNATQWLKKSAENFNKYLDDKGVKYEIVVEDGEFNILGTLGDQIKSGYSNYTVYFAAQSKLFHLIEDGTLLDVSDVYDMTAYTDTKPIKERMQDYEGFINTFKSFDPAKSGNVYAIPYVTGYSGLVFDYDYFLERGYLDYATASDVETINSQYQDTVAAAVDDFVIALKDFGNYSEGDYVTSAGKDGKFGTYDDGQKTTIEGFEQLIESIISFGNDGKRDIPFIYTNQYPGYLTGFVNNVMAQYMGVENYENFALLEGDIKGVDGTVQATLNMNNGYTAWDTEIINEAYMTAANFFYDYILGYKKTVGTTSAGREKMIWERTRTGNSFSHLSAQNEFLQSYAAELGDVAQPAFLVEGSYWENEAKATMEGLEEGRKYGQRDYRIYMMPAFEGQATPADQTVTVDGDTTNGVLINNYPKETGAGINMRTASPEKKAEFMQYAKEFMAYTMSEEMCQYYTAYSGIRKPFDYQLTPEQEAGLTPFQKTVHEILNDKEHIKSVNFAGLSNNSLVRCYGVNNLTCITYEAPYTAFITGKKTPTTWLEGIKSNITNGYQNALNNALEYLNK